jgi:hypothetical protein
MSKNIIEKKTCLKDVLSGKTKLDPIDNHTADIHPLINYLVKMPYFDKPQCFILPQFDDNFNDNIIVINKEKETLNKDNLINKLNFSDIDISESSDKADSSDKTSDKISDKSLEKSNINTNDIFNFSFPINNNNFLDVVFNIRNIKQLINWLLIYDINDLKTINLILDLYWEKYNTIIDQNIDEFYELNKIILSLIFNKKINKTDIQIISNKIISKNYGKKIKYIDEIKKYIN